MKSLRVLFGLVSWVAAAGGLWWCIDHRLLANNAADLRPGTEIWSYVTGHRQRTLLEITQPDGQELPLLGLRDPIFFDDSERGFRQVGEVSLLLQNGSRLSRSIGQVSAAEAIFYPSAPALSSDYELVWHATPNSMDWVVSTMLPPRKREAIAGKIAAAMEAHREEIIAELKPIVQASLRDAMEVIEEDLGTALTRHRDELQELGARYQAEVVRQELVPLAREEVWPIVQRNAEPVATKIGQGLWNRVSIWRFSWRYLYDKTPLPERNRFGREWKRFVEEEAVPELESHTDAIVEVVKTVLSETAKNNKVRAAMRENMYRILEDPEVHKIVGAIVKEVIVDNPRIREVFDRHWKSPAAQRAFQIASSRLEPTVHEIGQLLFGSREQISPEFKRVLRNRILDKDKRWLLIRRREQTDSERPPATGATTHSLKLLVRRGEEDVMFPTVGDP